MRAVLGCIGLLGAVTTALADPDELPELDRSKVTSGMARIQGAMKGCRVRSGAGGWVRLTVEVGPDGAVTSVTPDSDDAALGACVADIVKTATFGRTPGGGTFTYPVVFRDGDIPIDGGTTPTRIAGDLDANAISTRVQAALPRLGTCASKVPVGGTVRIQIEVAPNGKVKSARSSGGDARLADCVIAIIKTVSFPTSKAGGSFTHPFTFSIPPARQRAAIETAVEKIQDKLDQCATNAGLTTSRSSVTLDIKANGAVAKAKFADTVSPNYAKCLSTALTKARLPAVGGDATVQYTLSMHGAVAKRATDALERVLMTKHDDLDACGSKYDYTGLVDVTLTVRPNGAIRAVKLGASTPSKVASCLSTALAKRTLGPARDEETIAATLSVPYGQRPRDQAALDALVASARTKLDACAAASKFTGSLALTLTVKAEGTLSSIAVPEGTRGDLAACVQDALKGLLLPKASSASEETITLTFPATP